MLMYIRSAAEGGSVRSRVAGFVLVAASVLVLVWITAPPGTLRYLLRSPIVLAREVISFIRMVIAPPPAVASSGPIAFITLKLGPQTGTTWTGVPAGLQSLTVPLPASPAGTLSTIGQPFGTAPLQGSSDGTAVAQDGTAEGESSDQAVAPGDDSSITEGLLAPAQELLAPAEELLAPAEGLLAPAEELLAPAEELVAPAEELLAPAEELLAPAEQLLQPAEEIVNPSGPGGESGPSGETSPGEGSTGEINNTIESLPLPDLGAP